MVFAKRLGHSDLEHGSEQSMNSLKAKVSDKQGYLAIFEWFNIQTVIRSRVFRMFSGNANRFESLWIAWLGKDELDPVRGKVIFLSFQETSLSILLSSLQCFSVSLGLAWKKFLEENFLKSPLMCCGRICTDPKHLFLSLSVAITETYHEKARTTQTGDLCCVVRYGSYVTRLTVSNWNGFDIRAISARYPHDIRTISRLSVCGF